jgi:hypothetical protein
MADAIGHGLATRKYGSTFFKNGAQAGIILKHPTTITDSAAKRLKATWTKAHSGVDNAHKVAVLEEGMDAQQISVNAEDAQLIESQEFNLLDIANFFGLPPHKLGHTARTSYNSLEQENQSYLNEALDPWLVQIEEELYGKLLTTTEQRAETHTFEFNRGALLRADLPARGEYYQKALGGAPWMTIDEVRAKENALPLAGGSELLLPTNNFGAEMPAAAEPSQELTDREAIIDAIQRKHTAEVERITRRISANVTKKGAEWWTEHADKERRMAVEVLQELDLALTRLGVQVDTPDEIVLRILKEAQK